VASLTQNSNIQIGLLVTVLGIFGGVGVWASNQVIKLAVLENRVETSEESIKEVVKKLEETNRLLYDIKVELKKK
jgi:beta-lactamase regulating signal transducer with metallopeptidase domain